MKSDQLGTGVQAQLVSEVVAQVAKSGYAGPAATPARLPTLLPWRGNRRSGAPVRSAREPACVHRVADIAVDVAAALRTPQDASI